MSDASRLINAMRKVAEPKENDVVDIVVGTVTSVSPLKIRVDKLELTESFLILGAMCKRKAITLSNDALLHTHTIPGMQTSETEVSDFGTHTHTTEATVTGIGRGYFPEILLWRGLQVGDDVYMLRCCGGQKYYVIQRKEGVV